MPKKKKTINVKPTTDYDKIQIDIKGVINDDKKIKPDKIFDGYNSKSKKKSDKVPKGFHRMPDGSIMKDSDMKKKKTKKTKKTKKSTY